MKTLLRLVMVGIGCFMYMAMSVTRQPCAPTDGGTPTGRVTCVQMDPGPLLPQSTMMPSGQFGPGLWRGPYADTRWTLDSEHRR